MLLIVIQLSCQYFYVDYASFFIAISEPQPCGSVSAYLEPHGCHRTFKTFNFLRKLVKTVCKELGNYSWVILNSKHPCTKNGVPTKVVALTACSRFNSSRLTLSLWSATSQRGVRGSCFVLSVPSIKKVRGSSVEPELSRLQHVTFCIFPRPLKLPQLAPHKTKVFDQTFPSIHLQYCGEIGII